jgi:hypothetical protein
MVRLQAFSIFWFGGAQLQRAVDWQRIQEQRPLFLPDWGYLKHNCSVMVSRVIGAPILSAGYSAQT